MRRQVDLTYAAYETYVIYDNLVFGILIFTLEFRMNFKEALKEGFYELQLSRDWYREVTTAPVEGSAGIGMHADLILLYIRVTALLLQPIAPHFSEHLWGSILGESNSVQTALWTDIPLAKANTTAQDLKREHGAVDAGAYMRAVVKSVRDAEVALAKKAKKGAATTTGRKAVRLIIATSFPQWQKETVAVVQSSLVKSTSPPAIDEVAVKKGLVEKKLTSDKRAMPFVQVLKVRYGPFLCDIVPPGRVLSSSRHLERRLCPFALELCFHRCYRTRLMVEKRKPSFQWLPEAARGSSVFSLQIITLLTAMNDLCTPVPGRCLSINVRLEANDWSYT